MDTFDGFYSLLATIMLLLVVAGVFFFCGWYLSDFLRTYFEANVQVLLYRYFGRQKESALAQVKKECFCKKSNCQRYMYHDLKFHEPQLISERTSDALENFFDCIFERFIHSWYRNISTDDEFIDDIKLNLHFACDNLLYRLKEANVARIICRRIVPTLARHLHTCLAANDTNSLQHASGRDDRLLGKLSGHLHVAMTSRAVEQRYLRGLARAILPHLLHNTVHVHTRATCLFLEEILSVAVFLPALDVLASPDIVNRIILLLLSTDPAPKPTLPPSPMVRVLHNYHASFRSRQEIPIPVKNIHKLNNNPHLLHPFIEYLKSLHIVDLLILFRQLEEINSKVLQPDIPMAVKESIHRELQVLLDSVAHNHALPLLQIPQEFITDVQALAEGPPEAVDRLQKCDNWFKAHDALYSFLDGVVMRQFFKSSFYLEVVYRSGRGPSAPKSNSSSKRRDFSLTKLTNKVKDIFKMQSVAEGEFPPGPPAIQTAEDASILLGSSAEMAAFAGEETERQEGGGEAEPEESDWQERDLSSWEVTMPTISQGYRHSLVRASGEGEEGPRRGGGPFGSSGTTQLAFVIECREKGAVENSRWRIHRRYQEFYVLHDKLCEFHGSHLQDIHLPPKRSFNVNKVDFLERMKPEFQLYLQKLLAKTFLHKSELLYRFLRHNDVEFNSSINLGKFVKTVNVKLSKTRGQHLNGFLQSLLISTEARKSTPRRETETPSSSSLRASRLHNFVFWNNAAGALRLRKTAIKKGIMQPGCDQSVPKVCSVYDVLDWVLKWADSPHPYGLSLTSTSAPDPPVSCHLHSSTSPSSSSATSDLAPSSSTDPGPNQPASASRYPVGITWVRSLLWGLRPFLRPFVDYSLESLITKALTEVLREHRVVPVVHLLRDILFFDEGHQRSSREKQERREAAFAALMNLLQRPPLQLLFDKEELDHRLQEAFSLLQLPKLNKQLTYILLDDVLHDLFPEVSLQEVAAEAIDALSENGSASFR